MVIAKEEKEGKNSLNKQTPKGGLHPTILFRFLFSAQRASNLPMEGAKLTALSSATAPRIRGTCEDSSGVFLRYDRIRGEGGLEFHPADRTDTRVGVTMLGVHGADVNPSLTGRGGGF
jgi:hypothetical protein